MRVDAHHHFWDPAVADYPWLTDELAAIRRAFGPSDLAPEVLAAGIDATIVVQTRSSGQETDGFLQTAATSSFVRGVIGWVDLNDPAVADKIAELQASPGGDRLVGIRHQVQDEADPVWVCRTEVRRGIAAVGRANLAFDLLIRSRELPAALETVRQLPDVRFVVDHLAKPPIRDGIAGFQPWADLIAPFGELPNAWCKVSGMVTEAAPTAWRPADLQPFVDHVVDVFGPRRLMFGSDWPVCLLAASYAEVLGAARECLAGLGATEAAGVFGDNAVEVYRF